MEGGGWRGEQEDRGGRKRMIMESRMELEGGMVRKDGGRKRRRRDKKRKEKEDGGERTKEDEGKGKRKTKEERGWRTYPVSSPPLSLPSVLSSSFLVCLPVPFTRLYPLPAPAPARLDGNKHHINEWSKDRTSVHL